MRVLIFTDASTSAKLQLSIGAFFCIVETEMDAFKIFTTQQLTQQIKEIIIYRKYASKKSTASEIQTVIEALKCVKEKFLHFKHVVIYTDCQSLCDLLGRRKIALQKNNFITRAGKTHPNAELYKELYSSAKEFKIETFKIKGHASSAERITIQQKIFDVVDKLSRATLKALG